MFFIEAGLYDEEREKDIIVIGLFSTVEKAVEAARNWVKKEREEGLQEDICLYGWKAEVDSAGKVSRTDLVIDADAITLTTLFREIEKDFPPVEDE